MMAKSKYILFFIFLFLLTSCGTKKIITASEGTVLNADRQARFDYYYYESLRLKSIEKYDEQMEALRMCLEIDSTSVAAQSEIGLVYAGMKMLPEATKSFQKAVKAYPENWWYRVQLITLLSEIDQFQEALFQANELKKYIRNVKMCIICSPRFISKPVNTARQ